MTIIPETTASEAIEIDDTGPVRLRKVTIWLCEPCVNGEGGECHSPGCALWINRAPDIPVLDAMSVDELRARGVLLRERDTMTETGTGG